MWHLPIEGGFFDGTSQSVRRSAAELRHPRCLALTALFISLNIAMDLLGIRIQLTPTIRIGPGFLCNACIGMLFGPFVAMLAGICTDTLGYLVNSGGAAYFPGYMLTAMLGGILHGLFLYPAGRSRTGGLCGWCWIRHASICSATWASTHCGCPCSMATVFSSCCPPCHQEPDDAAVRVHCVGGCHRGGLSD